MHEAAKKKAPLLPLYRHKHLYEWSDEYQKRKYYSEEDFDAEDRLNALQARGLSEISGFADEKAESREFEFKGRYSALRQGTLFYHNIIKLDEIRRGCETYQELVVKCAAFGIDERKVKFYLMYVWFSFGKFFLFGDTKRRAEECAGMSEDEILGTYSLMETKDIVNYIQYDKMRKAAFSGKKHGACSYKEFIESYV